MTQQQALDILKTGANVFLTGEPGSGKTYLVNDYIEYLKKAKIKVAVTASTGIAATHIGGATIHSWSGIGIKKNLSKYEVDKIASTQYIFKKIIKIAVLIIDEVSMLDGAVLTSVDQVCRAVKQVSLPFGGLQVILVGDFFQLPPVSRDNEPPAEFAFASATWQNLNPLVCYLSEQHRQEDKNFLSLLNSLRRAKVSDVERDQLNARALEPNKLKAKDLTRLFSHNIDVDAINDQQLNEVKGPAFRFKMQTTGKKSLVQQLKRGCLSPEKLMLKQGAVVMFTKNNTKSGFVNGTLGKISGWSKRSRLPIVTTKTGRKIDVEPMEWTFDDNGRVLASIKQLPLRLAWAMTVHKSQGMSLDAAAVDLTQAFEAGQGYVALSRVRTLKGLFLAGYNEQALQVHGDVLQQDVNFRALSAQTAEAFAKLPAAELNKMQRNFMRAVGGRRQKIPG